MQIIRPLTLGGFIASVCLACGPARAAGMIRFAVNAHIVRFAAATDPSFHPLWSAVDTAGGRVPGPRTPARVGHPRG